MSSPMAEAGAGDLTDRVRRERLEISLASVLAASVHLAVIAGTVRASVVFVVATVIALAAWRFAGRRDLAVGDLAGLPRRSGRAVFFGSFLPVAVAPFGLAVLDPAAVLSPATWRSVALAGVVCSSIGALAVFHRTRMLCARTDSEARGTPAATLLVTAEAWAGSLSRQVRIAVAGVALGAAGLLTDGVVHALAQAWGPVRIGAAAMLFAAACVWLASLLARGIANELELALAGFRAESVRAADRSGEALSAANAILEAHVGRGDELVHALGFERDQQSIEYAHVDRLVRGLAGKLEPAAQSAGELGARIDSVRRTASGALAGGEALEVRARGLETEIGASAQWLDSLERGQAGLTASVERISSAARDTGAGLAELTKATRAVDAAADSITDFSRDVLAKAEIGRTKFGETVAGMEAIRTATQTAESAIRGLGARTQEIGGILDVIDDVGDQTSLLALNAAIIAAQAGEHGRAFSVVADEIRDLADRVLVSTKEIGGLIRAVQSESEHAIGAIEAGSSSVQKGVELSVEAGRTLDEITEVARQTGARIEAIVASVRSQATTLERVVGLAVRVEAAIAELAGAVDDHDGSCDGALRGVRSLRETVEEMRTAIRDQADHLARVEGDLGAVHDTARSLGMSLEDPAQGCLELVRVVEVGAERLQSLRAVGDELALVQRAIRTQADTLRAPSHRPAVQSARSSPPARATGERS